MTVFFINPFLEAAVGDFESIATVTVGSGGASSIEFTSIPGTYQHLQVRMIHRDDRPVTENNGSLRLNGDTGTSYAYHRLYGDGSSAAADGGGTQSRISAIGGIGSSATASVFGAAIIDILDYASTSKNKTVRSFTGVDRNGGGYVLLDSGLWRSTSAVTSITLYSDGSGAKWVQHSTAALYGIKAP